MMTSSTVNSATTDYEYDGDGVRVAKETTDYLYDRAQTGARPGESGLPMLVDDGTNAYPHAQTGGRPPEGGVIASIDGSDDALYLLDDALGSVRGVTDEAGELDGSADYNVFGEVRTSSGVSTLFRYTGELSDAETGFTYLRARYANPALGRFISADTVQPNAPGTQGYNLYAYVANNPTTWVDPSGHSALALGQVSTQFDPYGSAGSRLAGGHFADLDFGAGVGVVGDVGHDVGGGGGEAAGELLDGVEVEVADGDVGGGGAGGHAGDAFVHLPAEDGRDLLGDHGHVLGGVVVGVELGALRVENGYANHRWDLSFWGYCAIFST
jgi:RHS repeat-associated protein